MARNLFKTILLVVLLSLSACNGRRQDTGRVVVAYVTSWSDVMPDPQYMTHVNYAFGHVDTTFDAVRIDNPDRLRAIAALKEDAPQRELPTFAHALEPKKPAPDESDVYSKPVQQKDRLEEWSVEK